MTAGEESPARRFAAQALGLEPGIPAEQARPILLRRLRDEDYFLDVMAHEAIMVYSGRSESLAPRLAEAAARADVDTFAAEYFDLPIRERRDRWNALTAICVSHEHLLERLRSLEIGLDIERGSIPGISPLADRLIAHSLDLYVLPPASRAARRRELVELLWTDPAIRKRHLSRAIRAVKRRRRAVAKLAPDLLTDLKRPNPNRLQNRFIRVVLIFWHIIFWSEPIFLFLLAVKILIIIILIILLSMILYLPISKLLTLTS